jgi:hypothetical protein
MQDISGWLLSASKPMAAVTVVIVQLIKLFLPSDPEAPIGGDRFSVAPRFKKYLLVGTFLVGCGLSITFNFENSQGIREKISVGLQTGGLAVVYWEIFKNWVRPILERVKQ